MCVVPVFSPRSHRPDPPHSTVRYFFSRFDLFVFLTPFACDAIDREEPYVPRYVGEASGSSPPIQPMSVSVGRGRRSQSAFPVVVRPDQLREMIGEVVRESLQQAGVGNVQEPARVTPPQHETYQPPRRRTVQPQFQPQPPSQYYAQPQSARGGYQFQPQPVREEYQYPTGFTEHCQAMSTETVGTGSSERLDPIYHLPGPYQLVKFSGSRDLAVAEE